MFRTVRFLPALLCAALMTIHATAKAQANFGSVAVGSSTSATITVTVPTASSFTAVNVVTWGAAGLDFTQASGGTCATGVSYSVGQTCTVNVSFAPKYPGVRMGAVTLANPSNNTFATTFLQGTGTAPQLVFLPGVATAIYPTLNGYPLAPYNPKDYILGGVAINGAGTLSIASEVLDANGNNIAQGGFLEVPAGSSTATLVPASGNVTGQDPPVNIITPTSVRIDGAGDRIVNNGDTISLPPGASVGNENAPNGDGQFNAPAVDGQGNVYFFESPESYDTLVEYTPSGFGGLYPTPKAECTVYKDGQQGSSPYNYANGQAVDTAGNVFIASTDLVKVTGSQFASSSSCDAPAIQLTHNGTQLSGFNDIAIDAAGDLFLADYSNNSVVDAPAAGGEVFPISPVVDGKGLNYPEALAFDHTGNLYILDADNSRIVKIDRTAQAPLTFATTPVGTTSPDGAKAVVVKNAGTSALMFSSIVFPTDFPQQTGGGTNPCTTSTPLAPGASCNLNVTFTPQNGGALSESVVITDNTLNQSGTSQSFTVSGTGTAPALLFSATSVALGSAPVGYSTPTQTVTVTNQGPAVSFSSIALTGTNAASFSSTNNCGLSLANGASCNIGVRFIPTATGAATAAVTLTDSAASSPQSIALSGTGITAPAASLSLSASSLAFGSEPVGSSTASQNVNVTNTSSNTLYFKSIVLTGASAASYVSSNTCGTSIAAGATCRIGVRFAPKTTGAATAAVTITDTASGSPQSISLNGTGVALTLSTSSLAFGIQYVGFETNSESVILTNTSSATVSFNSIAVTGPGATSFPISNTCGTSLAAGAACQIDVQFDAVSTGALTATINVLYNGSASQASIALSGTGDIALSVSTLGLSFGNEPVGYSTATQGFTLTNYGAIVFTSISVTGPDAASFSTTNTCGHNSNPGSCQVSVRFIPTHTGAANAFITVVDNATDPASPQTIPLSGTGITAPTASLSLSSTSLSFGNETVGTSTATQNVIVTNTGSTILYFKSIVLSGTNASSFVTSNNCGASLAVGATCHIGARFVPTKTGALNATVTVTDNASNSPQAITLTGTGN